jgi:hypothetical protein
VKYRVVAAVIGLVTLVAACGTTATNGTVTTTSSSAQATNVCQTNPYPATPADVVVNSPAPFTISGNINAFEATFQIAIKSASGSDIIPIVTGHSQQGQTLSPFSQSVSIPGSTPAGPACLWVFQNSAATGNPSKIKQVPITVP